MKSILISINPKWCEKIACGEKTIEVRKTRPKLETPFKVYIYCTQDKKFNFCTDNGEQYTHIGNGKIIGEFVCDAIISHCEMANADIAEYQGCIKREYLLQYANGKELYGWHIADLVIYDKPRELSEVWKADKCAYSSKEGCTYKQHCFRSGQVKRCGETLTRPPQSWCYVEEVSL